MQSNKAPKIIQWWVTPKLPAKDIFEKHNFMSQWLIHPIKRRLARFYLKLLQKYTDIVVVGVTGSAGKSTTVQMMASILKHTGKTLATPPSIDPVYNIPNTILSTVPGTKYLILEMSVEYPGEMDYYLWLAQPKVGLITNIYPTHTQFFGDEYGVAKEKSKLIYALESRGIALLNKENKHSQSIAAKSEAKIIWFGKNASIYADNIVQKGLLGTEFTLKIHKNKISVHLPTIGSQYVENALAAASVGYILGASIAEIKKGLENFEVPQHRMKVIKLASGATLIDDSYNNNPQAAKETLKAFNHLSGGKKKVVVFGDMLELGELEESEHREIGEILASMKVGHLIAVGGASKVVSDIVEKRLGTKHVDWFPTWKEAVIPLKRLLKKDVIVLIKGSRSIHLENLVGAISR